MLFFGGFGSVFPYFVYLSLMWICILIGIRGQFKNILSIGPSPENKTEINTLKGQQESVALFFDDRLQKQRPGRDISISDLQSLDFTTCIISDIHLSIYHGSPIYDHIINSCGLRAPPLIIFS